ncbi:MAG: hypothetical protein JW846_08440 [Dehalococcoidia bacterium]|nr:hypothetical protein [Dehalococcoidia bacterium]
MKPVSAKHGRTRHGASHDGMLLMGSGLAVIGFRGDSGGSSKTRIGTVSGGRSLQKVALRDMASGERVYKY